MSPSSRDGLPSLVGAGFWSVDSVVEVDVENGPRVVVSEVEVEVEPLGLAVDSEV